MQGAKLVSTITLTHLLGWRLIRATYPVRQFLKAPAIQRFDTLMKQPPFLLLFLIATLLALPAQAVTVLDNITQYPTSNTSSWTVSDYADRTAGYTKIASAFTTGASDATLNSVSLLLNPSTNISLSSQSLTVAIYSDSTALSYYLNNTSGVNFGNITKTGVSHPLLQIGLLPPLSPAPIPPLRVPSSITPPLPVSAWPPTPPTGSC